MLKLRNWNSETSYREKTSMGWRDGLKREATIEFHQRKPDGWKGQCFYHSYLVISSLG